MTKWFSFATRTLFLISFLFFMSACYPLWTSQNALGSVSVEGLPIRLLVVRQALTYSKISEYESGLEYEILQAFALDVGYKIQVSFARNQADLVRQLRAGEADLGAARLAEFASQTSNLIQSPSYDTEKTSLVCRKDSEVAFDNLGQVASNSQWKLAINPETVHPQWISSFSKNAPQLKILSQPSATSIQLLRLLNRKKADCTLLDRLEAHTYFRVFRDLEIVKDVSPAQTYHFLFANSRQDIAQQFQKWSHRPSKKQLLLQLKNNFKNKTQSLTDPDVQRFLFLRDKLLPQYSALFRKHSRSFGIPWQLTAAVSYQESHWNSEAQSFTGVKGLMQLTEETADHVGVENRQDPNESVWGGVKYLKTLLDRQPKNIPYRERLALALATYNIGPAHMIDAQKLALRLGKNPYLWKDMQAVLPLLADKNYLSELRYGPARGQEPVFYVHRVLAFLDLIAIQI